MARHPDIISGSDGGRDSGGGRMNLDIDTDAVNPDIRGNGHDDLELEDSGDQGAFEDPQSNLDLEDEGNEEEGDEPEGDDQEGDESDDDQFEGLGDDEVDPEAQAASDYSVDLGNGKSFDLNKVKDLPREVKDAIKNGFLRQKDYTEKTQALSAEKNQWHETVVGASGIWENYNSTKAQPDQLLQWFSPQELLMAVASSGLEVDPSLLPIGWKPGMPNYNSGMPGQQQNRQQQPQQRQQAQPQQNEQNYEQEKFRIQTEIQFALNDGLSGIKDKDVKKSVREMALQIMTTQHKFDPRGAIKEAKMRTKGMLSRLRGNKQAVQKKTRVGRGGGGGGASLVGQGGNRRPNSWAGGDESAMNRLNSIK